MSDYDIFSRFYDAIMGDRAESTRFLSKLIRKTHPRAQSLLELGCGTGSVLKHLVNDYQVYGLDQSRKMLAIAAKKVPEAKLSRQNMVRFRLPRKFDVICCVYDSINHVLTFSEWKMLFANVGRHLSERGVFIFDINTRRKLDRHIAEPAWFHKFERNFLVMKVTGLPRDVSNWNIKVFEKMKDNRYRLHEENIREVSFSWRDVVAALRAHFSCVEVIDAVRKRPSKLSEKLYFICKK